MSKFAYVEFRDDAGKRNGADFLRGVVAAFSYAIHTVLTDGMAFADLPRNRNGSTGRCLGAHIFEGVRAENAITHKLTKPYHSWTNGQAERTGRTVKDATIKTFHYPSLESLKAHVSAFVSAYNFAKHLKTLRVEDAPQSRVPRLKHHPRHLQAQSPSPHSGTKHLRNGIKGSSGPLRVWAEPSLAYLTESGFLVTTGVAHIRR